MAVYYKTNVTYCSWKKQRQRSGFGCGQVRNVRNKTARELCNHAHTDTAVAWHSSWVMHIHAVEHACLGSVQDGGDKSDAFGG